MEIAKQIETNLQICLEPLPRKSRQFVGFGHPVGTAGPKVSICRASETFPPSKNRRGLDTFQNKNLESLQVSRIVVGNFAAVRVGDI